MVWIPLLKRLTFMTDENYSLPTAAQKRYIHDYGGRVRITPVIKMSALVQFDWPPRAKNESSSNTGSQLTWNKLMRSADSSIFHIYYQAGYAGH